MKAARPGDPGAPGGRPQRSKCVLTAQAWYRVMSALRPPTEATLFPRTWVDEAARQAGDAYKADREHYLLTTHGAHVFDGIRYLVGDVASLRAEVAHLGQDFSWHGTGRLTPSGVWHPFENFGQCPRPVGRGLRYLRRAGALEGALVPFPFFRRASEVTVFSEEKSVATSPRRSATPIPTSASSRRLPEPSWTTSRPTPGAPTAWPPSVSSRRSGRVPNAREPRSPCDRGAVTVELGIFARIFSRPRAEEVAAAVAGAGFLLTQLNLSSIGLPTLPPLDLDLDLGAMRLGLCGREGPGLRPVGHLQRHPPGPGQAAGGDGAGEGVDRAGSGARRRRSDFVHRLQGRRGHVEVPPREPRRGCLARTAGHSRPAPTRGRAVGRARLEDRAGGGNVVADATRAEAACAARARPGRARLVGVVLDPANLVIYGYRALSGPDPSPCRLRRPRPAYPGAARQGCRPHRWPPPPGLGQLDYGLVFELHAALPAPVPVVIQDTLEQDVPRAREFLLRTSARQRGRAEVNE